MQRDDRLRNRAELGIRTEHIYDSRLNSAESVSLASLARQLYIIVRANFVLITRKEGGA